MAKVRQLPQLYLRGALVNETMKNLTPAQRETVDRISDEVSKHSVMASNKSKFLSQLGVTIGSDYSNRLEATNEYKIAIWRGVVHILYHRSYKFQCKACGATSYQSKFGKKISIDRRFDVCPACKSKEIVDPGSTGVESGIYVKDEVFDTMLLDMTNQGLNPPTAKSCIKSIPGQKKVQNPDVILKNPNQLKKWFGEFVWNYFKQTLNENKITHHGRKKHTICGALDQVAVEWILHILALQKVPYQCDSFSTIEGYYAIYTRLWTLDVAEVNLELVKVKEFVGDRGGEVILGGSDNGYLNNAVLVRDMLGSAPCVEVNVATNERVQVVGSTIRAGEDETMDPIQQLEKPMAIDDYKLIDSDDTLTVMRKKLPDGNCQIMLDLMTTTGEAYDRLVEKFPETIASNFGVPRQNRIAEFLGCSPKEVKRCRAIIEQQMIIHGLYC